MKKTLNIIFILTSFVVVALVSLTFYYYVSVNTNWLSFFVNEEAALDIQEEQRIINDSIEMVTNESGPAVRELDNISSSSRSEIEKETSISGTILFTGKRISEEDYSINGLTFSDDGVVNTVLVTNEYMMSSFASSTYYDEAVVIGRNEDDVDGFSPFYFPKGVTGQSYPLTTDTYREDNLRLSGRSLAFQHKIGGGDNTADNLDMSNWAVTVHDLNSGSDVFTIEGATQPRWSPDGDLLYYFKNDGLYAMDMYDMSDMRLVGVISGRSLLASSMMDVSSDGQFLVWTTPRSGGIDVFKIDDGTNLTHINRVATKYKGYYWPVFSPDNYHYAVQSTDILSEEEYVESEYLRLEVRNILEDEPELVYNLYEDGFVPYYIFTDDWIIE